MNYVQRRIVVAFAMGICVAAIDDSQAVTLEFAGTQLNIGGTLFPNGAAPPCCIVPWRSDSPDNVFAVSNEAPNRYYGTAGYALFATYFEYPDSNVGFFGTVDNPIFSANDFFIDKLELPSFVTDSEILATHKAGGWAYALIDDPVLQHGYREWTFDGVNYPPAQGPCPGPECNNTGGIPYLKLGIITGNDIFGNNPTDVPSARWGFEVGEETPESFRLGVMTDGLDDVIYPAAEVFLTHIVDDVPVATIGSGQLVRNRFVDMHFFDITAAQPGDRFVISAKKAASDPGHASAGISGITFDIIDTSLPNVPGDYNEDGFVNAADYTVWRDHLGQAFTLPNEGVDQTPGQVTSEDYDFWKSQFTGGGGAVAGGVPEPGAFVMLLTALLGCLCGRRRR